MTRIQVENIPDELKALPQWVGWRYENRKGKQTKIPKNPRTGGNAMPDKPSTWGTFDAALRAVGKYGLQGIGFEFSGADPYTGIDLDKCISDAREIEQWAKRCVEMFRSYTEITPSGKGLHIIVRGKLPPKGRRKGRIEMYDRKRFFTVTGNILDGNTSD